MKIIPTCKLKGTKRWVKTESQNHTNRKSIACISALHHVKESASHFFKWSSNMQTYRIALTDFHLKPKKKKKKKQGKENQSCEYQVSKI